MRKRSTLPAACRNRHHNYPTEDPAAMCVGCGRKRGRARALGPEKAQGLRLVLGTPPDGPEKLREPSAVAGDSTPIAPPDPPSPATHSVAEEKRRKFIPRVARRLTQLFDYSTDFLVERGFKRFPNDAQAEDMADFEECLSDALGVWFPDVSIGPVAGMAIAATFIVAEKAWNAEKIPAKALPAVKARPESPAEPSGAAAPPGTEVPPPPPTTPGSAHQNGSAPAAATDQERTMLLDLQI